MYLCFFSCSILCYILLFLKPKDFQLTAQICYRYSGLFWGWEGSESSLYGRSSLLYRSWKGLIWFCSLPYMWSRLGWLGKGTWTQKTKRGLKKQRKKKIHFGGKQQWSPTSSESGNCGIWSSVDVVVTSFLGQSVCDLVRTVGLTAVLFSWTFAKPGSITFL